MFTGSLLTDDFARNGSKVYAPDLFEGDPVPADALSKVGRPVSQHCLLLSFALIMTPIQRNFDLPTGKWLGKYSAKHTGSKWVTLRVTRDRRVRVEGASWERVRRCVARLSRKARRGCLATGGCEMGTDFSSQKDSPPEDMQTVELT